MNEEIDDEPKSEHAGVTWNRRSKKWHCKVRNPLTKKNEYTKPSTFVRDEYDAAVAAVAALRARIDAECAAVGVERGAAMHGPMRNRRPSRAV